MKKIPMLFFLLMLTPFWTIAQVVPNIKLSTLNGADFQTRQFNETTGKPIVLSFWATWCIPCLNELSAIHDNLDDWKKESTFEFFAVSVDDSRTAQRVPAVVRGKGWEFEVLLDKNQDFKRELNLANIPYTIVIKDGKIIYRQAGYVAGNEHALYQIIKNNQ